MLRAREYPSERLRRSEANSARSTTTTKRSRNYAFHRPDSMKGQIDQAIALERITEADRKNLVGKLSDIARPATADWDAEHAVAKAVEWIHRYLETAYLKERPLPSAGEQGTSRRRLKAASGALLKAMKEADHETKKRVYFSIADASTLIDPDEDALLQYGRARYKMLIEDIDFLRTASEASNRPNGKRGQTAPHTYLVYRLAKLWQRTTGRPFTTSPDGSRQKYTPRDFINELLQAAEVVAKPKEKVLLAKVMDRTVLEGPVPTLKVSTVLTSAMTAAYRSLNRPCPGQRSEKLKDRSDNNARKKESDN